MDKKAFIEAGKEVFRYVLFAIIGVAVEAGLNYVNANPAPVYVTALVTAVLRAIDKYIHEDKTIEFKGLSPV